MEPIERFIEYAKYPTMSDEDSERCPSTEKQLALAKRIVKDLEKIGLDVTLTEDDWIVMVSDGVMIGSPDWIEKLIMSWHSGSAEELAAHIVDEAAKRRKNDRDDDITAVAMRVVENV